MPKKHLWPENAACLLVGDAAVRDQLGGALNRAGLRSKVAAGDSAAVTALEREPFSVAVISHGLGTSAISSIIACANRRHPEVPVVVLGSTSTVEEAVDVMRRGAADYLPPPVDTQVLLLRLQRLLEYPAEARPRSQAQAPEFVGLVGGSPAMTRTYATIEKISRYKTNILLLGESGTGKELIARALHARGPRRSHLFVPLNCATLGRDLLENELFGHEKGAFTGANERKKGLFELADGGTLFLDEIGEMDPSTQAKLLRVLERNEFRRVGGTEKVKVDLSVIAATNRNLPDLIAQGRFREDLYYRLKVVTVVVPPLRERREDIPALIDFFIADFNRRNNGKIKGISPQLLKRFMEHDWRGNVRELKNAVESAAILAQDQTLEDAEYPGLAPLPAPSVAPPQAKSAALSEPSKDIRIPLDSTLADAERLIVMTQVDRCTTRREAAQVLGIGLRTLYTKLQQFGESNTR
jgi:DNA-binding NtrC family response regulator